MDSDSLVSTVVVDFFEQSNKKPKDSNRPSLFIVMVDDEDPEMYSL